jgi:hypothetical protein
VTIDVRFSLTWTVIVIIGCRANGKEGVARLVDAAAMSPAPPDARMDAAPVATPGWVDFRSPTFTGPDLPHGGPDWIFTTPRLPAVSPGGDTVLVPETEIVLGGVPNLRLAVRRVADGGVQSSYPLLTASEFSSAGENHPGANEDDIRRAFADLAGLVRKRLAGAEAELSKVAFQPMAACRTEDPADGVRPPCSMRRQRIACPSLALHYGGSALEGTWRRHPFRVARLDFRPASVHDASLGDIPVRACFGDVWFDAERGALVGQLRNECQQGGDSCIVQSKWITARLARPSP